MLKILQIITTPFNIYGIGSVVQNYTFQLKEKFQFDFLACSGVDKEVEQYVESIGRNVIKLSVSRNKNPILYMKQLTNFLKNHHYDIVHAHGNSGTLFFEMHSAKQANVKMRIAHCHNTKTNYYLAHRVLRPFLNTDLTYGIACSNAAGKWLFNKDFTVLNNAIDVQKYRFNLNYRQEKRKELNLSDDCFVFLNVGRLTEQKNQPFIVELMPEYLKYNPKAKLIIVGGGYLEEQISKIAMDNNISSSVILVGKRNDVEKWYSAADCFLFPSKFEGLGLALVEAQASGITCISSVNVPIESNVTGNVAYLPLEKNKWLQMMLKVKMETCDNRVKKSLLNEKIIKDAGYDVVTNCKALEEIYRRRA